MGLEKPIERRTVLSMKPFTSWKHSKQTKRSLAMTQSLLLRNHRYILSPNPNCCDYTQGSASRRMLGSPYQAEFHLPVLKCGYRISTQNRDFSGRMIEHTINPGCGNKVARLDDEMIN
jgi:hypothetical protein